MVGGERERWTQRWRETGREPRRQRKQVREQSQRDKGPRIRREPGVIDTTQ